MKRLFVAINLPTHIKEKLAQAEKEINNAFNPEFLEAGVLKWVEPKNLHLTLLFLGAVADVQLENIKNVLQKIAQQHSSFVLKTKRICYGPDQQHLARLIWLEVEKNPLLNELSEQLKKECYRAGVLHHTNQEQDRIFKAHITLARLRSWVFSRMDPEERPSIDIPFLASIPVFSFELMESVLKRSGPQYTALYSVALVKPKGH